MTAPSLLLRNVATGTGSRLEVRLDSGLIAEIGVGLVRRGDAVVDGAGGTVIAGLHDQHVHLRAAVTARQSVDLSGAVDPDGLDQLIVRAVATVRSGDWLRATAWSEHAGGPLDRSRLDALTGQVPARVQHRSGAMWVLNSAALRAIGADGCELAGIERDSDGVPTGRLLRMDAWLHDRLTAGQHDGDNRRSAAGLAALAEWLASRGVTGLTDATPDRDQRDADELAWLSVDGTLPQRLVLMAPPGVRPAAAPLVSAGPVRVVLDDSLLPTAGDVAATITHAHRHGSRVAVHCVTADQLVVAVGRPSSPARRQTSPVPTGSSMPALYRPATLADSPHWAWLS
jgi:predicted amidohydrolase YtcJ